MEIRNVNNDVDLADGNGCLRSWKRVIPIRCDSHWYTVPALMTAGIITGINLITVDTIIAVGLLYGRGKVFRGRD